MNKTMTTQGSKVLIVGFGVSGTSAARHLFAKNVQFDIADQNVARAESALRDMAQQCPGVDAGAVSVVDEAWTVDLFLRYDCLVVSPGVSTRGENFRQAREAGVAVIGDVELFARSSTKPVIAVTGSNGKSTVVSMTGEILRAAGFRVAVIGNVGLACLDGLNDDAIDVYVLELSSFQLETTDSLAPVVSTVLNVSEDHMDRYNDLADYASVKRLVYRNADSVVINADDACTTPGADYRGEVVRFSSSVTARNESTAGWALIKKEGGEVTMQGPGGVCVDTSVLQIDGSHNQSNALVSMALVDSLFRHAKSLSVERPVTAEFNHLCAAGLGQFAGLPHRTQLVRRTSGISWFNDSKGTNVGACVSAIEGLTGPVVLIAGGRGKGADFSPLGDVVAQKCRAVVLIGEDAERIRVALDDCVPVYLEHSLTDAVDRASALAQPGDSVLLSPACASFDMFANFEARGDAFADEVNRLCA